MYCNTGDEQLVKLKGQHWALKDLPAEFKVFRRSSWAVHPVNVTAGNLKVVQSVYTVLGEGANGPLITEHGNTLCAQFDVSPLYPETVLLLHNFLRKHLSCVLIRE